MAELSADDRNVIAEHPLEDSLNHLRDALRRGERTYKPGSIPPDQELQKTTTRLFGALLGSNAALHLQSKTGNHDLTSELVAILKRVQKDDFDYQHYRALSQLVIKNAPDIDIWTAVFRLITSLPQTTPPPSIPPSYHGTPITHSSASLQGSEQTRRLVERRVFEEIGNCTYRDVDGFFTKYFEGKDWTESTKKIYQDVQYRHVDGRWEDFPDPPVQNKVYDWWFSLQKRFFPKERGVYCTSTSKDLTGSEAQKRQVDLFVKPNDRGLSKVMHGPNDRDLSKFTHEWKDVEVIGELKESNNDKKATLLQIGRYVRDVFSSQPTRRYVHAFSLCGNSMEAWVFDRSGPFGMAAFDIHDEPERFIRMIAGYVMMSDDELGLDTFTERDGTRQFITITEDATGKEERLRLDPSPIAYQRAIVCRGTACFRAMALDSEYPQYVVKFSWTSDRRAPETELLRLARQRGVSGVAELFGHRQIASIKEMREGLTFAKPHVFRNATPSSSFSQSKSPSLLIRSFSQIQGLGNAEGSGRKRKSVDAGTGSSKRSRSNSLRTEQSKQENEVTYAVEDTQTTSLFSENKNVFDNRIFRCLVISPAGKSICDFQSIKQLLEALRDAIKAHRSLYTVGKILHRDISENNIIITDPEKTGGFAGMLIDLDLAKEVGKGPSGARHRTGTMEFMAIEVLLGYAHTYRHDLESFFYVLLWLCARRGWKFVGKPKASPCQAC